MMNDAAIVLIGKSHDQQAGVCCRNAVYKKTMKTVDRFLFFFAVQVAKIGAADIIVVGLQDCLG